MRTRTRQVIVGAAALFVIGVCLLLDAPIPVSRVHEFGEPHEVTTFGGTNYVVELSETTVGRTDGGHAVIVYLNIRNPNDSELVLERDWFVLLGPDREYFQPSTTGTQQPQINVPAHGVAEEEMLSFLLGETTLDGGITLKIGKDYWVMLKRMQPLRGKLKQGQFRSFKDTNW